MELPDGSRRPLALG